ncbi:MAG: hypothetical protein RLZZ136_325, partial [Pseudomonadota bacterium]
MASMASPPSLRFVAALQALLAFACLLFASPLQAQTFPELSGRVVDAANIIPPDEKARLDGKLAALEQQSHRQVVIATLPDLQGYEISDYGYQLGRHWGIGDKTRNDGAILIIAPKERKVRIEVGYGLEPVLTDGLSALIVQQTVLPRFKAGDMPGGIEAGADAIIKQLSLPEDQARALAASAKPKASMRGQIGPAILWLLFILLFMVIPAIARSRRGSAYRSSGLGPIVLWSVLDGMSHGRGGGSNWGGGGGFSGGGGSFGGGGAS